MKCAIIEGYSDLLHIAIYPKDTPSINRGINPPNCRCIAENNIAVSQIKVIAEAAHWHGIEVGICGEAASSIDLIPAWLDYGIDVLSMSPSILPKIQVCCYQMGLIHKENPLSDR